MAGRLSSAPGQHGGRPGRFAHVRGRPSMSVGLVVLEFGGQFGEGVEFDVGGAGLAEDVAPGAASDGGGMQAGGLGWRYVVVEAVADVQDLLGAMAADFDQLVEERN